MGSPVRIGPAGWSYPDWEGRVYPRPKPRGFDPLAYLTRFVDVIEINATFYATPRSQQAARWVERVAERPNFSFAAKLHQSFTHAQLSPDPDLGAGLKSFLQGVDPLWAAGKLQALLVQFPVSFRRSTQTRRHLGRLTEALRSVQIDLGQAALPLVLELRHASWFDPEVLQRFRARGLSVASIDLPFAQDHPPERFEPTGPLGYLRLHGRNRETWFDPRSNRDQRYDYLYGPEELDELSARASQLMTETDELVVVTNNHFGGQAVANALDLTKRLQTRPVHVPRPLAEAFPHLAEIATVSDLDSEGGERGQAQLF